MDGCAVPFRAGRKRAPVGVEPLELRQQRRMNVEHASAPAPDQPRRQQPHKSGETNEIDPVRLKLCIKRTLEGRAIFAE